MRYDIAYERAKAENHPISYDGDLICNKCGEPWDAVGVWDGDMTKTERERFFNGDGCPNCSPITLKVGEEE